MTLYDRDTIVTLLAEALAARVSAGETAVHAVAESIVQKFERMLKCEVCGMAPKMICRTCGAATR